MDLGINKDSVRSEKGREERKRVVDEEGVPIPKGGEGGGAKKELAI